MSGKSKTLRRLWATRPHTCHWCDAPMVKIDLGGGNLPKGWIFPRNGATVDHITPREWGGTFASYDNAVLACRHCNEMRAAAGHCMAALDCAIDVLGDNASTKTVARFYHEARKLMVAKGPEFKTVWADPAPETSMALAIRAGAAKAR